MAMAGKGGEGTKDDHYSFGEVEELPVRVRRLGW